MSHHFAAFWASVLIVIGVALVVMGILSAALALTLDMPWGRLTGQAVLERTVAAVILLVSGILAGGPFIVVGEMMRLFISQHRLIHRIERRLRRHRRAGPTPPRPA